MGEGDSELPRGEAAGHAQRGWRGDECDCGPGAGIVWRRGGLDGVNEDDFQARGEFPCRSHGTECVLRRARIWDVRGGEWNGCTRWIDSVWVDVLLLRGLLQAGDSAGGADEGPVAVCVYA